MPLSRVHSDENVHLFVVLFREGTSWLPRKSRELFCPVRKKVCSSPLAHKLVRTGGRLNYVLVTYHMDSMRETYIVDTLAS